jgi:hypothetical protein
MRRADTGTFCFEVGSAYDDEAFFFIGNIEETVEQMNGLLFVLG